jgi:hypothetical protein
MPYRSKKPYGNPTKTIRTGRPINKRKIVDDSSASASELGSQTYLPPDYKTFPYMTQEGYDNNFEHLDKKHKINEEESKKNKVSLSKSQLEQTKLNQTLEGLNEQKRNQGWVGWALGSQRDIDNQIKCCTDNINKNKEYCSKLEGEISELYKTESSIINNKKEIREQYDNSETHNIRGSTISIRSYNIFYIELFLKEYISRQFGKQLDIYNKALGFLIEQLKSKIEEIYELNIDQHKIEEEMLINASEQIDVFKSQHAFQTFLENYGKKEAVNNRSVRPLLSLTRPVDATPSVFSFSHGVAKKPDKSKKRGSGRRARRSRKSKK